MLNLFKRKREAPGPVEPRRVPARVLTASGWMRGKLSLPGLVRLVDFVGREEYLTFIDVEFEGDERPLDFFALRRNAVSFLIVESNESLESTEELGYREEHHVTCRITAGALTGVILLKLGARLSDYLTRHDGLVPVRECHYRVRNPFTGKVEEGHADAMLINPEAIVGVSEKPIHEGGAP